MTFNPSPRLPVTGWRFMRNRREGWWTMERTATEKREMEREWGKVTVDDALAVVEWTAQQFTHPADFEKVNRVLTGVVVGLAATARKAGRRR